MIVLLAHVVVNGFFDRVLVGMIWKLAVSDGFLSTNEVVEGLAWRKLGGGMGLVEAM